MKREHFEQYSNDELKIIMKNLKFYYDGNDIKWEYAESEFGGLEFKTIHKPIIITDERFHALPENLKIYITKPNDSVGNVRTRVQRCVELINREVIRRFFNES